MNNNHIVTDSFFRLWGNLETLRGEPICDGTIDILKPYKHNNKEEYKLVGRLQTDSSGYYNVVLPIEDNIEYKIAVDIFPDKDEKIMKQGIDTQINVKSDEIVETNRNTFYENLTPMDFENFPYMQI